MTTDPTPYTPDDEEVFSAYADAEFGTPSAELQARWDRWLAARDARVRAEAWFEGYGRGVADERNGRRGDDRQSNPHCAASIEQETQP